MIIKLYNSKFFNCSKKQLSTTLISVMLYIHITFKKKKLISAVLCYPRNMTVKKIQALGGTYWKCWFPGMSHYEEENSNSKIQKKSQTIRWQ